MESKASPPRGFGSPPVANGAQPQAFARRNGPPVAFGAPPVAAATEQNAPPPPPHLSHPPHSFGFPAARGPVNTSAAANRRGWKPGRVGGRHDSPLYGKHRKRPSSSSMDSNVSWSGSEIESVGGFVGTHSEQEQVSRLSWASSVAAKDEAPSAPQQDLAPAASLFGAPAVGQPSPPPAALRGEQATKQAARSESAMSVQPPKTPLGKPTQDSDGEFSAVQRVRMELSAHAGSRAESRADSSENEFATIPPAYDEEKSGPQSCPSTFGNTKQPQFSIDKLRQLRSNELVASKLLPTRTSVNSLMGYVRELQLSEATLRKQLVKTKQHTEEELSQSLSKVSELERTMMEVERDRELARRKMEEQEKLIRDLAAKLKQAEAAKAKVSTPSGVDELPPIAEETLPQADTEAKAVAVEEDKNETPAVFLPDPAPPVQPSLPPTHQEQPPPVPVQPKDNNRAVQFGLASPRSPTRPLWDPWASGGATPMKNLPPVFTIGSTGLDPGVALSKSTAQASTTDTTTTARGEYELKSVLMSPRREASENCHAVQPMEQDESAMGEQEFTQQYPGAVFNVGTMPSPPYPQQEDFSSSETQDEVNSAQGQQEVPSTPIVPVETVAPAGDNSFEQQQASTFPPEGGVADANDAEWNGFQAQQEMQPSAASVPSPAEADVASDATKTNNKMMAPPAPTSFAGQSAAPPPPQAVTEDASHSESVQVTQPEQAAESVATSMPSIPPLGSTLPPPISGAQPHRPASPVKKESEADPAEPVSLETLLVDFFTKVDQKRLKMATVYGKRYAGREKWLFAELTKRYGAAKVAALKARYEGGTATSTTSNSGDNSSKQDDHVTKSLDSSDRSKTGRQGHPRHPQFFHPPAPASSLDLGAGMPPVSPPVALSKENNAPNAQAGQETKVVEAPPSPSGKVSRSNIPSVTVPPPSFPTTQKVGEKDSVVKASTDGPSVNGPPPPVHREKSMGSFNQPPPPLQPGMETSNPAPLGLRQRHNASVPSPQAQQSAAPAVTLEGLLKELYKNHQPDKLKNVSIVAKQYAGKERELVGLLKGKYGALSVKRLEENLDVLERAHRAHIGDKGAGKKRGCFVRTISLVFWLSVLLYFSFGAVFVSFVVLDAWECRALDNDDQEAESAEECVSLKKELETFTYERVADYMSQSHPEVCFCSEWKAREIALFSNLSGDSLLNLARLVPFSPDSFGSAWIASVKEQVPSQEFYDSYAKPVVDLSLDAGSLVWFSVLELAGYDEVSEQKSQTVEDVMENDIPSLVEDSLNRAPEEVENESYVSEVEAEPDLAEETKGYGDLPGENEADDRMAEETETDEDFVPSVEVLVEEEELNFDNNAQVDENGSATKEDMSEDDSVPVEEKPAAIEEESLSFAPEVVDKTDTEVSEDAEAAEEAGSVDANIESADLFDTEVVETLTEDDAVSSPVEEADLVDADVELSDVDVSDVTEIQTEDDSVIAPVELTEAVDDGDDEVFSSTEVEVVDATDDAAAELSEVEKEESTIEERTAESDDVIEIEVMQEGVDLSYTETVTDAIDEELSAESSEVPSSVLEAEIESEVVDVDEGVLSELSEAEPEMDVESKSFAIDSLEESEYETDTVEEASSTDPDAVESTSGVDVPRESDIEMENDEEESVRAEELEVDAAPELSEGELDIVVEDVATDSSIPADVDEVPVLESEDEVLLGAANGADEEKNGLDVAIEVETETGGEEEVVASEEDHVVDEEVVEEQEFELSSSSNEVDAVEPLSEDSSVGVLNEGAEVANDEGSNDEESVAAPIAVIETFSEDADMTLDDEDADKIANINYEDDSTIPTEVEASIPEFANINYEDDSTIPVEAEASIPELEAEEDVAEVVDETVVQVMEDHSNDASERNEDVEEASTFSDEIEPVALEEVEMDPELVFPTEAGTKSVETVLDEEAEEDNSDSELSTLEVEESAPEVHVIGEESVAIEATETLGEADTGAVEPADYVPEQIEDLEIAGFAGTEEVKAVAVDDTESVFAVAEETPNAVDEVIAIPADEESLEADHEALAERVPESEEAPVIDVAMTSVESADEVAGIADETEPIQAADESSTAATGSEEEEIGGLASAVNEVLARLVEPFEAAKSAAPDVASDP